MRLAETVRYPVSLVALSIGVMAGMFAPSSLASMTPPSANIESVEAVHQREQVRARGEARPPQREQVRAREAWPHHSVWRGTYVCAQGESAMTLTIDADREGTAKARYDFGATPSNPSVPTGAFLLEGAIAPRPGGGFTGELAATQWIVHPDNYFMVPLSIWSDGRKLIGKSQHETCMEFAITRIE